MTAHTSSTAASRGRRSAMVAGVVVAAVGLAMTVGTVALRTDTDVTATFVLGVATWYLVGAVIVARQGNNVVGWLFVAIGMLWTATTAGTVYAQLPTTRPGAALTWASWAGSSLWIPAMGLTLVIILVFPTGREPTPAWRPVLIFILAGCFLGLARMTLGSTLQASDSAPEVSNPIGIQRLGLNEFGGVSPLLLWMLASAVAVLVSFVVRFRRSEEVERQQLKWMAYLGTPVLIVGFLIGVTLTEWGFAIGDLVGSLALTAIPISALMAITRSRLYEIDRIVSRTASYAVVTGALLLVYAVVVTSLTRLLPDSSNTLTVATATLAAAAAFRPLLARVQKTVDRRFDRARYDGQRTVDAFASRLRDEVDADQVSEDLLSVVRDTVQPAGVGLWLRGSSS